MCALSHSASLKPPARIAILVALTCTLTDCSFGNLKARSTLTRAGDLRAAQALAGIPLSPANWPSDKWWEIFGDPQLNELVADALDDGPDMRIAMARVRQAEAFRLSARSRLFPEISAAFQTTRERYSTNSVIPPPVAGTWQWFNDLGLGVEYEVDFWGKNHEGLEAALDARHALEVDSFGTRVMLAHAIVQIYIELADNYEQRDLAERTLQQQTEILDLTQRRVRAELDSQVDLKQAEAAIPAVRQLIAGLDEAIALNQDKLAALLGQGPDRGLSIRRPRLRRPDSVTIPSILPAELLGHRPEVVAQRWRVEAAGHAINVAKAQFYPNINLTTFAGFQSLGYDAFTQASSRVLGVTPALSLPIFEGGQLRANLAAQDAAYDIAVESYNQTVAHALSDIADQLNSLRWLRERLEQQQAAVKTSGEAWQLAKDRYSAGLAPYIQVLVAENTFTSQQRQLTQLQSSALSLQAQLIRALGGGYIPDRTTVGDNPPIP